MLSCIAARRALHNEPRLLGALNEIVGLESVYIRANDDVGAKERLGGQGADCRKVFVLRTPGKSNEVSRPHCIV